MNLFQTKCSLFVAIILLIGTATAFVQLHFIPTTNNTELPQNTTLNTQPVVIPTPLINKSDINTRFFNRPKNKSQQNVSNLKQVLPTPKRTSVRSKPTNTTLSTNNYTLFVVPILNSMTQNTDIIVELTIGTGNVTFICPEFQNSTSPIITTLKGSVFKFDDTPCHVGLTGHVVYTITDGKNNNIPIPIRPNGIIFTLNRTE